MLKILLVRHGYSLGNVKNIFCGKTDLDLAEKGFMQAEVVCDYIYKNYNVQKLISSPLCRAINTIKPLANLTGLEIETNAGFIEQNCGDWEMLNITQVKERFLSDHVKYANLNGDSRPTNGESMAEVSQRAKKALDEICERYKDIDGTIVIATHGCVLTMLTCVLKDRPLTDIRKIGWANNASITEIEYNNGKYELVKFSFDDYLGDNKTGMIDLE